MLHLYLLGRPDGTLPVAQRITDLIRSRYRGAEIVWDVPAGEATAFAQRVETTMQRCNAVLVVIGPGWLQARSPRGLPWQDDPFDPVAVSLAAALRQKKLIVPLLVHGAVMPATGDLAPQFAAFVLHQGVVLRQDPLFLTDLQKVYVQLNTQLSWRPASPLLLLTAIGIVISFVAALAFNHKPYVGPHFVIGIIAILLSVALSFAAFIGAFVLAIQRRQMGWLAGLVALTLAGMLTVVGAAVQAADPTTLGAILLALQLLSAVAIAIFALFGKRREMV